MKKMKEKIADLVVGMITVVLTVAPIATLIWLSGAFELLSWLF